MIPIMLRWFPLKSLTGPLIPNTTSTLVYCFETSYSVTMPQALPPFSWSAWCRPSWRSLRLVAFLAVHPYSVGSWMQRGVETAKKVDIKPIKKMVGAPAALLQSMRSQSDRPISMSRLVLAVLSSFSMGIIATLLVLLQTGFLQFWGNALGFLDSTWFGVWRWGIKRL